MSSEAAAPDARGAELPEELDPRRLLRRALQVFGLIAVLVAVALLAPGLGELREILGDAELSWLALATALEALSFASYIVMFGPVFCTGLSLRRSWQIGGSELAMGSIVPASGAGGIALGAWILSQGGMDSERIARRSVAFLLIKSSVNFFAVAALGVAMFAGLGPELSPLLTLLPAGLAIAAIAAVGLIPRWGVGSDPGPDASRPARLWSQTRTALTRGTGEAIEIIRARDLRVIGGSVGYWVFDNAVLWATFHAFGFSPALTVVLMGYLLGQLGGLLPIPGGIGGIDGGLIGAFIVYGVPAAAAAAAVLAYRAILFWMPLLTGAVAFIQLRRDMPAGDELAACTSAYGS